MVIYKLQFPIELKSRCWGRRERTKAETVRVARNRSCWRPEPREKQPVILLYFS